MPPIQSDVMSLAENLLSMSHALRSGNDNGYRWHLGIAKRLALRAGQTELVPHIRSMTADELEGEAVRIRQTIFAEVIEDEAAKRGTRPAVLKAHARIRSLLDDVATRCSVSYWNQIWGNVPTTRFGQRAYESQSTPLVARVRQIVTVPLKQFCGESAICVAEAELSLNQGHLAAGLGYPVLFENKPYNLRNAHAVALFCLKSVADVVALWPEDLGVYDLAGGLQRMCIQQCDRFTAHLAGIQHELFPMMEREIEALSAPSDPKHLNAESTLPTSEKRKIDRAEKKNHKLSHAQKLELAGKYLAKKPDASQSEVERAARLGQGYFSRGRGLETWTALQVRRSSVPQGFRRKTRDGGHEVDAKDD